MYGLLRYLRRSGFQIICQNSNISILPTQPKLLDAVVVQYKQRNHAARLCVPDQRKPPIVQHDPVPVEPGSNDSVILICCEISLDNKFHILFGDARLRKCDIFGDSVILAIAATRRKRLERRTPAVGHPPLCEIADSPYRHIDSAIDRTDAGAAIAGATFLNDRKKTFRCWRTAFHVLTAMRQNLNVGANIDLNLPPLGLASGGYVRVPPRDSQFRVGRGGTICDAVGIASIGQLPSPIAKPPVQ
jgi:hypothetical protein